MQMLLLNIIPTPPPAERDLGKCITLYPLGHIVPTSTELTVPGRSHVSVIYLSSSF